MPARSKPRTTTEPGPARLPRKRPPTHPGEVILEEFVKPIGVAQVTLRLSRVLGMSADVWLGLQHDWDLWQAMNGPDAKEIRRLKPLLGAGRGGT